MVLPEKVAGYLEVKTRPLDDMVSTTGCRAVDFIELDIEGAERKALKGSAKTLRRLQPRLMLDMRWRMLNS